MNFFGKYNNQDLRGTMYPESSNKLISSGFRELVPGNGKDSKPFLVHELFRDTFHNTIQNK